MDSRCRTCLRGPLDLTPLYDDPNLIGKIQEITSIEIIIDEDYPSNICRECLSNINILYNFRKVVIHNDKELRERSATLKRSRERLLQESEIKNEELSEPSHAIIGPLCTLFESEDIEMATVDIKTKPPQALEKKYLCRVCNISFPMRHALQAHKQRTHVSRTLCNMCGITCRTDNLKKHQLTHISANVKCKICGKTLKNSESLRGHMFLHKGLQYVCHVCGRVCKVRWEYQRHLKAHADPNAGKRKCQICGKFVWDMKKHLNSHTGERPHVCSFCKKGFTSPYALRVHKRQHTNERPYNCEFCSMAFPQKVSLTTHLKSKHKVA